MRVEDKEAGVVKTVAFVPAYDRSNETPNYGIHNAVLLWVYRGPLGAINLEIDTGWYNTENARESVRRMHDGNPGLFRRDRYQPKAVNLSYHSTKPFYRDQTPHEGCEWIGTTCYADGTGLDLERFTDTLVAEGEDRLWELLAEEYVKRFET